MAPSVRAAKRSADRRALRRHTRLPCRKDNAPRETSVLIVIVRHEVPQGASLRVSAPRARARAVAPPACERVEGWSAAADDPKLEDAYHIVPRNLGLENKQIFVLTSADLRNSLRRCGPRSPHSHGLAHARSGGARLEGVLFELASTYYFECGKRVKKLKDKVNKVTARCATGRWLSTVHCGP